MYPCTHTHAHACTHVHAHIFTYAPTCTYKCMLPQDQDNSFQVSHIFIVSLTMQPAAPALVERGGDQGFGWVVYLGLLCSLAHCMKRMGLVTGDRPVKLWFCLRKTPASPWGVVCCVCFWFISWKGVVYTKMSIWEDNERGGECVFACIVE